MIFGGWRKKVDRLRMVILSGGHQGAKELAPGISRMFEVFARVAASGDGRGLRDELALIPDLTDAERPLWEPVDIYGWEIQATMYLRDGDLWWLVHANRRNESTPADKDIKFVDSVIDILGGEPTRNLIIGPRSSPPGNQPLPFGWWTWKNRTQLFDIQVNKNKKRDRDKMRIVPLGSRETDGYQSLDLSKKDHEE